MQCMGHIVTHLHTTLDAAVGTSNTADETDADEGSSSVNVGQIARVRDGMLDMLTERAHDVSAYTRAVVHKTWCTLAEANLVPAERFNRVVDISVDRFVDKTAAVRKAAMQLFTILLDNNPFAPSLNPEHFIASKARLTDALAERSKVRSLLESCIAIG